MRYLLMPTLLTGAISLVVAGVGGLAHWSAGTAILLGTTLLTAFLVWMVRSTANVYVANEPFTTGVGGVTMSFSPGQEIDFHLVKPLLDGRCPIRKEWRVRP
jgi:hypothetical protein